MVRVPAMTQIFLSKIIIFLCFANVIYRMPWLVLHVLRACVSRQLLIHNNKRELAKFEITVLLKHCWKQDYKAAATARRLCEVEGEDVVSERVTQ